MHDFSAGDYARATNQQLFLDHPPEKYSPVNDKVLFKHTAVAGAETIDGLDTHRLILANIHNRGAGTESGKTARSNGRPRRRRRIRDHGRSQQLMAQLTHGRRFMVLREHQQLPKEAPCNPSRTNNSPKRLQVRL